MRQTEILSLTEVAMNPNSLRAMAAKVNAVAGMEFEMYVPDAGMEDDDGEMEPDYDEDGRAHSIDEICNFYENSDYNSRRDLNDLRAALIDEFQEWIDEDRHTRWINDAETAVGEYMAENDWDEDAELENILDELKQSDENLSEKELNQKAYELVQQAFNRAVEKEIKNQGRSYDAAYEEWSENDNGDVDERDWLRDVGITHMSDVENRYRNVNITWPYMTSTSVTGSLDMETVADKFSIAIGRPVNHGSYHSSKREPGKYNIETDSSLDEPNRSEDGGLEFISPPLPLVDMLSDLQKVKAWADSMGCYTNDSTGLHINVSVPNFSPSKFDYVKLAVLLGDKYVLDQFGRTGSTYAKSSMAQIESNIRSQRENIPAYLDSMRSGLAKIASNIIHSGSTAKHVSINNKNGYIEFRSPGGDWLKENFNLIENTLLRFVVALDAACDPLKYRKEYLTKLYKLLSWHTTSGPGADSVLCFAKYVAGDLTKSQMIFTVKQIQKKRQEAKIAAQKQDPNATQPEPLGPWARWIVTLTNGQYKVVSARNSIEATEKAKIETGIDDGWVDARRMP